MSLPAAEIVLNLARVRDRIAQAASRAGRSAEEITLVAISKTHPPDSMRVLYEEGVRHFGENRVQEWDSKRNHLVDIDATWHMIGHVQSNKAGRAARLFNSIDTADSVDLAERLEKALLTEKQVLNSERPDGEARQLRVLIEVKLDPQAAKSGISDTGGVDDLTRLVETMLRLPHLKLRGLMGIPPYFDDPEKVRPYFRRMRELRNSLHAQLGNEVLTVLSMGMSHDFEVAIEEGATEIRVGAALFGERQRM